MSVKNSCFVSNFGIAEPQTNWPSKKSTPPQNIPLTWLCAMHFLLVSLPGVSVMTAGISLIFMPGWVVIIPITNLPFPIFQGILH